MADIALDAILEFLNDENLGPHKLKNNDDGTFEIRINEPGDWGTRDIKKRCGIGVKEIDGIQRVVFKAFKAAAQLGDEYEGGWYKFVKLVKNFDSVQEAKLYFRRYYELRYGFFEQDPQPQTAKPKSTIFELPDHFIRFKQKEHYPYYNYLLQRKVEESIIQNLKLFVDLQNKMIVFPIYQFNQLIAYAERDITGFNPYRWLKFNKEDSIMIWNLENCIDSRTVILFEGVFDAIHFRNGIALLGVGSEDQLKKIMSYSFTKYIVIMDNDYEGKKAKIKWAKYLHSYGKNVFIYDYTKIPCKDFGGMKEKNIPFEFETRLHKWNYKTEAMMMLGTIC